MLSTAHIWDDQWIKIFKICGRKQPQPNLSIILEPERWNQGKPPIKISVRIVGLWLQLTNAKYGTGLLTIYIWCLVTNWILNLKPTEAEISKVRITIILSTNSNGTEKLLPPVTSKCKFQWWSSGTYARPTWEQQKCMYRRIFFFHDWLLVLWQS
jgi:hypothetical protein